MPKVSQEREKCIGCGSCAALCPKYWEMAEDGKSKLLNSKPREGGIFELEVENIECNQEAADACPVQIIHIIK
jgi:ferredoxin